MKEEIFSVKASGWLFVMVSCFLLRRDQNLITLQALLIMSSYLVRILRDFLTNFQQWHHSAVQTLFGFLLASLAPVSPPVIAAYETHTNATITLG